MTKAASQSNMNALHSRVAEVFLKVLQRYEDRLDAVDAITSGALDAGSIEQDVLAELMTDGSMPSPAMMSAITKFLKDNEVLFEKEVTEQVSAQQRALEEKRKNRPNLAQLSVVPKVTGE